MARCKQGTQAVEGIPAIASRVLHNSHRRPHELHWSCVLLPRRDGNRLKGCWGARFWDCGARFFGSNSRRFRRRKRPWTRLSSFCTSKTCYCRGWCSVRCTKYYILWFVLDLHHRQRYFCICGCYETMTQLRVAGWFCRVFTETTGILRSPIRTALRAGEWLVSF
jgi:hypothetical protein